ncbi:unnamed protein product, partial [Phaeothamnion confervicola]
TVVTAADGNYFPRLENLVGSLHHWEPGLRIIVHDLGGFTAAQRRDATAWADVELVRPPWGVLPRHFALTRNVAWKPFVVLAALEGRAYVLWLDANFEV